MTILLATASGEQHGLINTLTNAVQFDDFKNMDPKVKAKVEKEKKEDARLVKARYINHRGKHERLTKPYCKYAGDPIQQWHFIPGYVYTVPFGLIKEVNETYGALPERSGLQSVDGDNVTNGTPLEKDRPGDPIHEFVPVSF